MNNAMTEWTHFCFPNIQANRAAALKRLEDFLPRAGSVYAETRNYDLGAGALNTASGLSPYIRHRLLTEEEVVQAAIGAHGPQAAAKFIDEVFWRTYWKGWLEMRPTIWTDWCHDLTLLDRSSPALAAAERGETGIACFDHWAQELQETGYLHNHARMWFASLWIFALGLPWQLGAAFFLRHLLDGDPASNTLSWRWVAGLHTQGKAYLATPGNIEAYTKGRFRPAEFTPQPAPAFVPHPPPRALPDNTSPLQGPALLLLTEEDLNPESLKLDPAQIIAVAAITPSDTFAGPQICAFRRAALDEALARTAAYFGATSGWIADAEVTAHAASVGARQIVTAFAPIGPVADRLTGIAEAAATAGMPFHRIRRDWDTRAWPLASKGFFAFRQHIPALIGQFDEKGDGGA